MSKKGSETPRKSRRLVDKSRSEDFHAPSFNILSQTQTHKSTGKEKSRSVKSKMKKTNYILDLAIIKKKSNTFIHVQNNKYN